MTRDTAQMAAALGTAWGTVDGRDTGRMRRGSSPFLASLLSPNHGIGSASRLGR